MTAAQATHLIEQFASQCPLAIWILDHRGIAIFANKKISEIFEIEETSSAVGINILKLESFRQLNLESKLRKLTGGKTVALTTYLEDPRKLDENLRVKRKASLHLRIVAYVLKSSKQTIEHFVIFLEDTTSTQENHEILQKQVRDIQTFKRSKETRGEKLETLKKQTKKLQAQIKELGYDSEAS